MRRWPIFSASEWSTKLRAGVEAVCSAIALIWTFSMRAPALLRPVPLEAVGAILRHRSLDMTAHYAKVDVTMLETIAQPWPGEVSC